MSNFVTVGFTTEGTTDERFLPRIIRRAFEKIAFECNGEIEVFEPEFIKRITGPFVDQVFEAAQQSFQAGLMVLCIHSDADSGDDTDARDYKFIPARERVNQEEVITELCKNLVAIIPVHMTEAWMLADTDALRNEIDTNLTDVDLGIHRNPEAYANPKHAIQEAIRIARASITRRRRYDLDISDLYQILGQEIDLNKLERLTSYQKFEEEIRVSYRRLGYLH